MIKGIGIDLIELERIEKSIKKNDRLVTRILTRKEQNVFRELKSERRRIEFLAGRFAAKEAFAKATGQGIGKLSFQDMEVLPSRKGDRKSTRLNSSHVAISYAVFCLKKKNEDSR